METMVKYTTIQFKEVNVYTEYFFKCQKITTKHAAHTLDETKKDFAEILSQIQKFKISFLMKMI